MPNHISKKQLILAGFSRVERDDRLLDVFPKETPEKGVELWEKWNEETVEIVRCWNNTQTQHQFERKVIEQALSSYSSLVLASSDLGE